MIVNQGQILSQQNIIHQGQVNGLISRKNKPQLKP